MTPTPDRPNVFVCCADEDAPTVREQLAQLNDFDFTFTNDIQEANRRLVVSQTIECASSVLYFASPASVASGRCQEEINHALDLSQRVVSVLLGQSELPPGLKMSLGTRQAIEPSRYAFDDYLAKLRDSLHGEAPSSLVGGRRRRVEKNQRAAVANRLSIVVLPITGIGNDEDTEFLAEAITDDLTTQLGRVPGIMVIARGSAASYKGKQTTPQQVAAELKVGYAVLGSIRKLGDRVRANVRLIDAATGQQLAANRFDGESADVFDLTDTLVREITGALRISLVEAEANRSARVPPEDMNAWLFVQRAHHTFFFAGPDTRRSELAIQYVDQALALDPEYSHALAMSGFLRGTRYILKISDATPSDAEVAVAHGKQALNQAPQDPFVLFAWGVVVAYVLGDPESALPFFERSIALDPNNAHVLADYGMTLGRVGNPEEGAAQIRRAMQLSPKDPRMYLWQYMLAASDMRDAESSLVEINRSLSLFEHQAAFPVKAFALMKLGRIDEARATLARMREVFPQVSFADLEDQIRRGSNRRKDLQDKYVDWVRQIWD